LIIDVEAYLAILVGLAVTDFSGKPLAAHRGITNPMEI
jgi:hypothetical protein